MNCSVSSCLRTSGTSSPHVTIIAGSAPSVENDWTLTRLLFKSSASQVTSSASR